jgi:beta-N-acetylhexosaminidase
MTNELDELVARCLFPSFSGLTAPDWLKQWLGRGLGGVVLFARNVRDREQLASLTAELRAEQPELLVAIDEEGGDVTRLESASGSSYPGNHALGAIDDPELTEEIGAAIGAELAAVGVDFDFAPVADVNSNPDNPVIGVRSFGSNPELVGRHVGAFVRGLQRVGVAACAKHFPGHGDTETDSHLQLPVVGAGLDVLRSRELVPFRSAVEAGVQAVMTAHLVVPALEDAPATVSRRILHDLLRTELGFDGLVVTDALEMRGLSATVGVEAGAVRALAAGADALCIGAELGAEALERIESALRAALRSGALPESRLRQAAARVARTERWTGSVAGKRGADRALGMRAARKALETRGDPSLVRPPFVLELVPEPSIAAGEAALGLGDVVSRRVPSARVLRLHEPHPDVAALAAPDRQLVLAVRDVHRHPWQREFVDSVLASTPDAIVVETGVPAWQPPNGSAYVATHGAARVNLEAAADVLGAPA